LKENSLCDTIKIEEEIVEAVKEDGEVIEQIIDFNDMSTSPIKDVTISS
jgi:hypothetical protein